MFYVIVFTPSILNFSDIRYYEEIIVVLQMTFGKR